MFTTEEVDAIAVGARLVRRLRDPTMQAAAESVLAKIAVVLPQALRAQLSDASIYVSDGSAAEPPGIDPALLREAIRTTRKLLIRYANEQGEQTERTIWPLAMACYVDVTLFGAWCELRQDYRHVRIDRITRSRLLDEAFPADNGRLAAGWLALPKA